MKKFYNILLALLIIAALVVGALIIIKYGKNYINEKNITNSLLEMQEKLNQYNEDDGQVIEQYYDKYKIEGIIEIPKINIKYPVLNETNEESMKLSVTKFWGPEINGIGNFTVAGHNNRDGTMFGKTSRLQIGDIIRLTDLKNRTVEYQIFKIYSIDPDDVSIVESVEPGDREVTLITCTNGHRNRLITKAREVEDK